MSGTQIVLFTLVVSALSLGIHAYIARRLLRGFDLAPRRRRLAWGVALGLGLTMPWVFRLMPFTGTWWADLLQRIGWTLWGFVSLLFALLLVIDLVLLIPRLVARLRGRPLGPADPGRRAFLQRALSLGVVGLSGLLGGAAYVQAQRLASVRRITIPIDGLPDALVGLKIAQISDLHVGPTIRDPEMSRVVAAVNELNPDLIAVTGDLVDGTVERLRRFVAPLAGLRARHGTFFVTGNHEYFSGALPWCEHCRDALGWTVLSNEHALVEHEGAKILIAGVTDLTAARFVDDHASDPAKAIAGAPPADLRLLLAHQPKSALAADGLGFHLQLSGHTHGGQYFPFTLLLKAALRFYTGLQRVGAMWVYINAGTTYWGPPFRLGADQEITLIELAQT